MACWQLSSSSISSRLRLEKSNLAFALAPAGPAAASGAPPTGSRSPPDCLATRSQAFGEIIEIIEGAWERIEGTELGDETASPVTKPEEPNAEPSEFGDETASLAGAVTSTGATSGDAGSGGDGRVTGNDEAGSGGDGRVTGNDEAGSGGDGRVTGSDAVAIGSDAIATGGEAGADGERSNWCMKAGMEPLAIDLSLIHI